MGAGTVKTGRFAAMIGAMSITITLNGDRRKIEGDPPSVGAMVEQIGLAGQAVAVEVNRRVVPKRQHAEHALAEGDVVEVVSLVGGG